MPKEESLLSLDSFKKKLTDKKAIKDSREKEAAEYHRFLVKEADEACEKFVNAIIPYLDEYQNTVGGWSELSLKVDNSKYYFHISYYERQRLYMDVNTEGGRIYKVEYKKSLYCNGSETVGFPEINKHLIALKRLFDGNSIKNKIANDLLERIS
jgi:hypothetical protein